MRPGRSGKADEGIIEPQRKSIRKELQNIKAARKEQAAEPKHEPTKEQPEFLKQQLASTEAKKATGEMLAALKEDYSLRTLPITNEAGIYFERQYARRDVSLNSDFVVCREDGRPLSEGHISRDFNKLLNELGLPYCRFHDLRHAAAINMHQLTGDFYTVGEILGHSLKGIGNQLGFIGGLEAVTKRYVDVRLERKRVVLETYHKAVQKKATKEMER